MVGPTCGGPHRHLVRTAPAFWVRVTLGGKANLAVWEAKWPPGKIAPFSRVYLSGSVVCLHRPGSCTFPPAPYWRPPGAAGGRRRPGEASFFFGTRAGGRRKHFFLPFFAEATNTSGFLVLAVESFHWSFQCLFISARGRRSSPYTAHVLYRASLRP